MTVLSVRACSSRVTSALNNAIKMKYLNVAEKNDAAKTIAGHLSRGTSQRREGMSPYNKIYEFEASVHGQNATMLMTSVSGHLLGMDFAISFKGWHSCDPIRLFDAPITKTCPPDFVKIKTTLEREIRTCNGLIIWTDCDREGENIGFEIIDVCRAVKPNIPVYRAVFSEITRTSVCRALNTLVQPDERKSKAVDVRIELDLRIGAAFTRFQTLRFQSRFPQHIEQKIVSYGSCQFPTLGFVAKRYKEAESFIAQPFWKIKVSHTIAPLTVNYTWCRDRLFDKQCCEAILMVCNANPAATVRNVVKKPKSKWRPLPMDTVELEKLGSRKLKITAKETMTIAEKLYTKGYISYPRTETNTFSNEMNLNPLVEIQVPHPDWGGFASRVVEWGPNPRSGSKSDQAHPPIHPTKLATDLSGNEKRVYELIVRHFLACVSRDATGSETLVTVSIAGEEFNANGLCIHERNYLEVYPYDTWNSKEIHPYETGQTFQPTDIAMNESTTTAPAMLTEADLIALMEKHGIGTDATHAEHINTIKERGYIGVVERGFLVPGTLGMGLVEGYDAMEIPLVEPKLRADLEIDLKRICSGQRQPADVLVEQVLKYKEAYQQIVGRVRLLDNSLAARFNEPARGADEPDTLVASQIMQDIIKCPRCRQNSMVLRKKNGTSDVYVGCLGFPDCKNAIWLGDIVRDLKITEEVCARCGPGNFLVDLKFKQVSALAVLNATSNVYRGCLGCDQRLKQLLGVRPDSAASSASSGQDSGVGSSRGSPQRSQNSSSSRTASRSRDEPPPPPPPPTNSTRSAGEWPRPNTSSYENRTAAPSNWNRSDESAPVSSDRGPSRPAINGRENQSSSWPRSGTGTQNRTSSSGWNNPPPPSSGSRPTFGSSQSSEGVNCSKCNQPAKQLTVKKDGPNKGRQFYVCHNEACKFFKWAEDGTTSSGNENMGPPPPRNLSTGSWGSGSASGSGPNRASSWSSNSGGGDDNGGSTASRGTNKRRCGICREEGHTKQRCPMRPAN